MHVHARVCRLHVFRYVAGACGHKEDTHAGKGVRDTMEDMAAVQGVDATADDLAQPQGFVQVSCSLHACMRALSCVKVRCVFPHACSCTQACTCTHTHTLSLYTQRQQAAQGSTSTAAATRGARAQGAHTAAASRPRSRTYMTDKEAREDLFRSMDRAFDKSRQQDDADAARQRLFCRDQKEGERNKKAAEKSYPVS